MSQLARRPRSRLARAVAGSVVLSLATGSALLCSASPAAATDTPRAQAVGRFLDGAVGGSPIQSIADLHDARATNPGTVSDQNPLEVTVGGQADIPLSHKLQLPGHGDAFHVGVANQIAKAKSDGYSLGAAGAIANQGGASLGGASGSYPSDATLDLSAAAFGPSPIPLPDGGQADALGGLTASIGAVSAKAYTPAGVGRAGVTHYNIAGLKLTLASPGLAKLLAQLAKQLTPPALPSPLPKGFPKECSFKTQFLSPVTVGGGALSIDPSTGALTLDVAAALRTLGLNLNYLPANTDLLAEILKYLTGANGLAAGMQAMLVNTFTTQKQNFANCAAAITAAFPAPLKDAVKQFFDAITKGQDQLQGALDGVIKQLSSAGGSNPLAPIADGLKQALQIGVNVQPNGAHGTYTSPLRATPDQATPVVAGQTIVRAIEIDLGGGKGVSLALANAAAGPSTAAPSVASAPTPPAPVKHNPVVPTGIPAGQGPIGGAPGTPLPLVLLAIGAALAAAGGLVWRLRPHGH